MAQPSTGVAFGERRRAGLLTHDAMSRMAVDRECTAAVERCGHVLEGLGWHVEVAHSPALDDLFIRTLPAMTTMIATTRAGPAAWISNAIGRELVAGDLSTQFMPDPASAPAEAEVRAATATMEREAALIASWWDEYDLLVTPTLRQPAWPLSQNGGAQDAGTFPFPFTMTGQPAASLPLAWSERGLPIGVQLVARHGADRALLSLCADMERAVPWADRWPQIAEAD